MLSYLYSLDVSQDELCSVLVVYEFFDVFEEVSVLPPCCGIEFRADLEKDAKAVVLSLRHMAHREYRELDMQVVEPLRRGFIRRIILEWSVSVMFSTKANSFSLRLCMDYQDLNKLTRKNKDPLPCITDLFGRLGVLEYSRNLISQLDFTDSRYVG